MTAARVQRAPDRPGPGARGGSNGAPGSARALSRGDRSLPAAAAPARAEGHSRDHRCIIALGTSTGGTRRPSGRCCAACRAPCPASSWCSTCRKKFAAFRPAPRPGVRPQCFRGQDGPSASSRTVLIAPAERHDGAAQRRAIPRRVRDGPGGEPPLGRLNSSARSPAAPGLTRWRDR